MILIILCPKTNQEICLHENIKDLLHHSSTIYRNWCIIWRHIIDDGPKWKIDANTFTAH